MKRILISVTTLLFFGGIVGCGGNADSPETKPIPITYTATGNFHNFVVSDGNSDTQLTFKQADVNTLAENIVPNGAGIDRELLLNQFQDISSINFSLSLVSESALNPQEVFPLTENQSYVFFAMGDVRETDGVFAPKLVQHAELSAPPAGEVTFRISHMLVGIDDVFDVYVNGEIVSQLSYGETSAQITFPARAADQDEFIIISAGMIPNGNNELFSNTNVTLFNADYKYEVVIIHESNLLFNGDINGKLNVLIRDEAP